MQANLPQTLALDFDGVLCDGLKEYFQTAWRAYRQIWPTSNGHPPDHLAPVFSRLRPVVEIGWEMPVLLRAILKGFTESEVLQDWPRIRDRIIVEEDLSSKVIGGQVDAVRDQWIADNRANWLQYHQFYPGVTARLQQLLASQVTVLIVTTKEGRFVQELLHQEQIAANLNLAETPLSSGICIFGKELQQPKSVTLRQIQSQCEAPIWFVEDRLPTLEAVKAQTDLENISLFLADWGYNTPKDQKTAAQDHRIHLLSLSRFGQDFSQWL